MSIRLSRPLLAALAATALILPFHSAARADETARREAMIIVSAEAEAAVAPDQAIISLSVVKTEKTAGAALSANSAALGAVLKALRDQGIAEKDLQTSGFSIQPQYIYPENEDGVPKPPELTGYTVTNGLNIRVRDIAKLGGIIDQSVSLGINQGGDIRFVNSNPEKTIEQARIAAVKNAMAKAKTLADAAGTKIGRLIEISENVTRPEPQPMLRMSMAKESADAAPIAAGENSYSVTVNVTFAIDQ